MTIANTLRLCAGHMEPLLTDPGGHHIGRSSFICDNLIATKLYGDLYSDRAGDKARRFLCALGMGSGFSVFSYATQEGEQPVGYCGCYLSHIEARVCWLHFAADLAEEWGDDVCIALSQ